MDCIQRVYYIDRSQLAFFKFVLEGHEGLALITTLDPKVGKIAVFVPPGREGELDTILEALEAEVRLRPAEGEDKC
ncbi:MAG: DUF4911 domain-containing protein [Deltaproteobacteria bacterium]|nr:DUF4911 domain-containing protein [Deltaproteobacteria bacterium]